MDAALSRRPPPTWRQMHPGEDPRIEAMQFARFRDASSEEKMRIFSNLYRSVRRLAWIGLQERHPGASRQELRRWLADMLLGPELAEKVYGRHGDQ